jgi:hypothetical protein
LKLCHLATLPEWRRRTWSSSASSSSLICFSCRAFRRGLLSDALAASRAGLDAASLRVRTTFSCLLLTCWDRCCDF